MIKHQLIQFAIATAQAAGNYLMENFGDTHSQTEKESLHSIVTTHDIVVEKLIIDRIKGAYPSHGILSEESGAIEFDREYLWVIDPLDGSSYFARGLPNFSVAIALVFKNEVILGVVENPVYQETFYATKGGGAFRNQESIKVSTSSSLSTAIVNFGHRYLRLPDYQPQSGNLLTSVRSIRGGGSCAQELCQIACGRADGLITVNQAPWDFLAGKIILEEAGGKLVKLEGNEISVKDSLKMTTDIVATNGILDLI
jgi:myo-inositol-1(or 4)-monophosphatase